MLFECAALCGLELVSRSHESITHPYHFLHTWHPPNTAPRHPSPVTYHHHVHVCVRSPICLEPFAPPQLLRRRKHSGEPPTNHTPKRDEDAADASSASAGGVSAGAPQILPCGHSFCRGCIGRWLQDRPEGSQSCPVCRRNVFGDGGDEGIEGKEGKERMEDGKDEDESAAPAAAGRGNAAGGAGGAGGEGLHARGNNNGNDGNGGNNGNNRPRYNNRGRGGGAGGRRTFWEEDLDEIRMRELRYQYPDFVPEYHRGAGGAGCGGESCGGVGGIRDTIEQCMFTSRENIEEQRRVVEAKAAAEAAERAARSEAGGGGDDSSWDSDFGGGDCGGGGGGGGDW